MVSGPNRPYSITGEGPMSEQVRRKSAVFAGMAFLAFFQFVRAASEPPRYTSGSLDWRAGAQALLRWDPNRGFGVGVEGLFTQAGTDVWTRVVFYFKRLQFVFGADFLERFDHWFIDARAEIDPLFREHFIRAQVGLGWRDLFSAAAFGILKLKNDSLTLESGLRGRGEIAWAAQGEVSSFYRRTLVGPSAEGQGFVWGFEGGFTGFVWRQEKPVEGKWLSVSKRFALTPIGLMARGGTNATRLEGSGVAFDLFRLGAFFYDLKANPWPGESEVMGRGPSWHHDRNAFQPKGPATLEEVRALVAAGKGTIFAEYSFFHAREIDYRVQDPLHPGASYQYIYDAATGLLDESRSTGGSYDYFGPVDNSGKLNLFSSIGHTLFDLCPYLLWGN